MDFKRRRYLLKWFNSVQLQHAPNSSSCRFSMQKWVETLHIEGKKGKKILWDTEWNYVSEMKKKYDSDSVCNEEVPAMMKQIFEKIIFLSNANEKENENGNKRLWCAHLKAPTRYGKKIIGIAVGPCGGVGRYEARGVGSAIILQFSQYFHHTVQRWCGMRCIVFSFSSMNDVGGCPSAYPSWCFNALTFAVRIHCVWYVQCSSFMLTDNNQFIPLPGWTERHN